MDPVILLGVFASAFLSATLLFGLSEISLIASLQMDGARPIPLFIAATLGNVLGALVNYCLGLFLLRFETHRWFPLKPHQRLRAEALFARFGQPTLLLSWLPVIGDPLTLVAGILRMPLPAFLFYVTIGKAARYAVILWAAG